MTQFNNDMPGSLQEIRRALGEAVKLGQVDATYQDNLNLSGPYLVLADCVALAQALERGARRASRALPDRAIAQVRDEPLTDVTIHAAGPVMHYDTRIRQRCMWCGTALVDQDLARVAVAATDDDRCLTCGKTRAEHNSSLIVRADKHDFDWDLSDQRYPTWEPGSFVAHGPGISYHVLSNEEAAYTRMSDLALEKGIPVCMQMLESFEHDG